MEVRELISTLTNDLLLWLGFGTLVGLVAKAIMPGKDPGGTGATVFLGIVGALIGAATYYYITSERLSPISITGFIVGLAGAGLLLVSFRVLNGTLVGKNGMLPMRTKRTRRRVSVVEEK